MTGNDRVSARRLLPFHWRLFPHLLACWSSVPSCCAVEALIILLRHHPRMLMSWLFGGRLVSRDDLHHPDFSLSSDTHAEEEKKQSVCWGVCVCFPLLSMCTVFSKITSCTSSMKTQRRTHTRSPRYSRDWFTWIAMIRFISLAFPHSLFFLFFFGRDGFLTVR